MLVVECSRVHVLGAAVTAAAGRHSAGAPPPPPPIAPCRPLMADSKLPG